MGEQWQLALICLSCEKGLVCSCSWLFPFLFLWIPFYVFVFFFLSVLIIRQDSDLCFRRFRYLFQQGLLVTFCSRTHLHFNVASFIIFSFTVLNSYILKENLGQCFWEISWFCCFVPHGKASLESSSGSSSNLLAPPSPTYSKDQVDITTIWPDIMSPLREINGTQESSPRPLIHPMAPRLNPVQSQFCLALPWPYLSGALTFPPKQRRERENDFLGWGQLLTEWSQGASKTHGLLDRKKGQRDKDVVAPNRKNP